MMYHFVYDREVAEEKSKEAESSKVREFMQERWNGFERKGIDAMLLREDTTYPEESLKHISKVVSIPLVHGNI